MTDKNSNIRTRFAPAPTGVMHIGNVRAALLNYLYARQKQGTFILRIEDTDAQRMFDTDATEILFDLAWLGLSYDEGPRVGGDYGPYFQSQRNDLYQQSLQTLINKKLVYRCFCTPEELDKKRQRQLALKQPPRYDKSCLALSQETVAQYLDQKKEFIWRFEIKPHEEIVVHDLAKGSLHFNTSNLTDFPLTRTDGSFTFLFANAIDDITMKISHVFRGEDHLTNSASQLLLYRAFNAPAPVFLHLPIICNLEGKKLSKRDFGFSIKDLQDEGYLPEAVCNYLGIIGGSYEQEILSLDDLVKLYNFENLSSTSQIKYDPDKLRWINHKWIQRLSTAELAQRIRPFLEKEYAQAVSLSQEVLESLVGHIKTDIQTLHEANKHLAWYFNAPRPSEETLHAIDGFMSSWKVLYQLIEECSTASSPEEFVNTLKQRAHGHEIATKTVLQTLRTALTGMPQGLNVVDVIKILGYEVAIERLHNFFKSVNK